MNNLQTDWEALESIKGLYVGMLSEDEMEFFNQCVSDGMAYRSYEGTAGLMGLAKVRVTEAHYND